MQDLGTFGGRWSAAYDVSADGSVVVGWADNTEERRRAFRWTAQDGMQDLDTLGGITSVALSVSANGLAVVGRADYSAGGWHAFRWTAQDGMQDLGTLGGIWSEAYGVSADGSVVVGWSLDPTGWGRAFRWTTHAGMEDLTTTYANRLTSGSFLMAVRSISSDGRYIVGVGFNADTYRTEAFLLDTVTEPASMLSLSALLLGLLKRRVKR